MRCSKKIRREHEKRTIAEMCRSVASWCRLKCDISEIFFPPYLLRTRIYRKWKTHQKAILGRLRIAGAKRTCHPGISTCISFSRKSKAMQLPAITHPPFPPVSETHFSLYVHICTCMYICARTYTRVYTYVCISIPPSQNSISRE